MPTLEMDVEALEALRGMVESWIGEGFSIPPYSPAQYRVFEALGLPADSPRVYDITPPHA